MVFFLEHKSKIDEVFGVFFLSIVRGEFFFLIRGAQTLLRTSDS